MRVINMDADFNELGIAPELLEVLNRMRFTTPTPIQHQCIPAALEGKDIAYIGLTRLASAPS